MNRVEEHRGEIDPLPWVIGLILLFLLVVAVSGLAVAGALPMSLSPRELWTVMHGMVFGAIFLLAFAGGLAGIYSLRPEWVTIAGIEERMARLRLGTWVMAIIAWLTVFVGTYIVYPWYRAKPPQGTQDLTEFPRYFLVSRGDLSAWHTFGMEWKEHVAWFAPILATAVAYVVSSYGPTLVEHPRIRMALLWMFVVAFAVAGVAGVFGAFLNKVAPIR